MVEESLDGDLKPSGAQVDACGRGIRQDPLGPADPPATAICVDPELDGAEVDAVPELWLVAAETSPARGPDWAAEAAQSARIGLAGRDRRHFLPG